MKRHFRNKSENRGLALSSVFLANVHLRRHEIFLGKALATEALQLFRSLQSKHGECSALFVLATAAQLQRKHFEVISVVKEALPLAQEVGDSGLLSALLYLLALSSHEKGGRPRDAAAAAAEARSLFMERRCWQGWAEFSLAVQVKALLSETSRQTALEVVREHACSCRAFRALRPCLLVRDILLEALREMRSEPDRTKASMHAHTHAHMYVCVCAKM